MLNKVLNHKLWFVSGPPILYETSSPCSKTRAWGAVDR